MSARLRRGRGQIAKHGPGTVERCSSREGTILREFDEIRRRLDPDIVDRIALGAAGLSGQALEWFCAKTIEAIANELLAAEPRLAQEACVVSASAHVRAAMTKVLQAVGAGRA